MGETYHCQSYSNWGPKKATMSAGRLGSNYLLVVGTFQLIVVLQDFREEPEAQ